MNETKEANQPNPTGIELGTVTLFLHLPIPLAKKLLDRIEAGAAPTPSSALLEALYTGACVGLGPNPEAEIEACLTQIETRLATPGRLASIRSKIAQPVPPAPKPEPVKVAVPEKKEPESVSKRMQLPEDWENLGYDEQQAWIEKHIRKPMAGMKPDQQEAWQERVLNTLDISGEDHRLAWKRSFLPGTFAKMENFQKDFYIRYLCDQPGGKACLRWWLGIGSSIRLFRDTASDEQKATRTEVLSVLGAKPASHDDKRAEEVRAILVSSGISLKE